MRAVVFQIKFAEDASYLAIALQLTDSVSRHRQELLEPVAGNILLSIKSASQSLWASETKPYRWSEEDSMGMQQGAALSVLHSCIEEAFDGMTDGMVLDLRQFMAGSVSGTIENSKRLGLPTT